MTSIFTLLPLLLMAIMFTALVKLSAFAYRRTALRWRHAFVYFLLVLATVAILGGFHKLLGSPLPLVRLLVVSLVAQVSIGGWYRGPRAKTNQGVPLAFRGGALLAALAYFIIVAVLVLPALVHFSVRGTRAV